MAMKHRKLFPTTTNQTLDCPDICDPTCPYGCFPYPQFYFIPPPPPPPPPSTTSGHHLSPDVVIIIITLIVTFFVLLCYYAIFVKTRSRRHRFTPPPATGEFLDENRGPTIDNPIWYITTVGLQQSVINSITAVKYSKAGGLIDGTDCSVCLNEFREEETLRLLPKCSHAFHIQCIDTWLRSHTNCPMCRCGILSNSESNSHCGILSDTLSTSLSDSIHNNNPNDSGSNQATQTEMSNSHCGILSNTLSTSPNDLGSNQAAQMERSNSHCSITLSISPNDLGSNQAAQMERSNFHCSILSNNLSTSPNDLGSNQATQMERSNSHCGILSNTLSTTLSDSIYNNNPNGLGSNQPTQMEIPDHDGELGAKQTGDPIKILQNDDETKEGEFWVVDIYADNDMENGIQIQPMKRSISIDSSVNIDLTVESEGSSINSRISSISKSLHKTPVSMKRSCSYSGRSNLSRHYRNHKAMIRL